MNLGMILECPSSDCSQQMLFDNAGLICILINYKLLAAQNKAYSALDINREINLIISNILNVFWVFITLCNNV